MADVSAIFGILLSLGIAFPGLLTCLRLLFPNKVNLARTRVGTSPWRCFWLGSAAALVVAIPIIILYALPFGPAKLVATLAVSGVFTLAAIGAAGIADLMALRISRHKAESEIGLLQFVQGAVILELAAVFPVLGWLFILPVAILVSLGASIFSVLNLVNLPAAVKSNQQSVPTAPEAV